MIAALAPLVLLAAAPARRIELARPVDATIAWPDADPHVHRVAISRTAHVLRLEPAAWLAIVEGK